MGNIPWEDWENDYLIANFNLLSLMAIGSWLGRSEFGVRNQVKRLKKSGLITGRKKRINWV